MAAPSSSSHSDSTVGFTLPPIQFVNHDAPVAAPHAKLLALYFSAKWCGPCRAFTPLLKEFYANTARDDLEIAFISLDRDEAAFQAYFADMPWLAASYACEREEIYHAFGLQGVPSLVIFEPSTGRVLTTTGREDVVNYQHDAGAALAHWQALSRDAAAVL